MRGAIEAKNIAIATFSHYLNNATMAIYGHTQMMSSMLEQDKCEELVKKLPASVDVIAKSAMKIVAVVREMKDISPMDQVEYYNMSQAINLDDRIDKRMQTMDSDSGLVLPEEVADFS
jgi:signal transduction histidine kinase